MITMTPFYGRFIGLKEFSDFKLVNFLNVHFGLLFSFATKNTQYGKFEISLITVVTDVNNSLDQRLPIK